MRSKTILCALALAILTCGCGMPRRAQPETAQRREQPAARPAAPALSPAEFGRGDFDKAYALSAAGQYSGAAPAQYAAEPYAPEPYAANPYPANPYAPNRYPEELQASVPPAAQYAAPAGDYAAYRASRGAERLGGYGRPAESLDNVTNARIQMNTPERGETLFSGGIATNLPGANLAQASSLSGGPVAKPFAGAHVGRSNFSKSPQKKSARSAPSSAPGDKPWENGGLFTEEAAAALASSRPAARSLRTSRFLDGGSAAPAADELWPAGTAMVPPSPAAGAGGESLRPPKTAVRLPPPAPAAAPRMPAPRAAAPAAVGISDGIFSPSMQL